MSAAIIACAYCATVIKLQLGQITIKHRGAQIGVVKCPACDSTFFTLHATTKRKSKGKRLK